MTGLKKALGAGIALAMAVGVSACGSSSDTGSSNSDSKEQSAKLTVWSASEDQANADSWLPKMEKAFEKAHSNYKIAWKNSVVAEGDAATTVKQDPAAAADVYLFANDQLGTLVDSQAIGELSDDALSQVKKQNDESMVASVTGKDGKVYGVPYTGNTWFMYYNKSKFTADDVKSLDAMLAKGKVALDVSNSWYLPSFYVGAGGSIFGADGTKTSDGIKLGDHAEEVTKYLVNLIANPNFVNDSKGAGLAAMKSGQADALFSGTWDASEVKKALGDNYAAIQPPSFKLDSGSYQMKAFSGSKAAAYNPNSKSPKIAAQFAAFLGSTQAQKEHFEMRSIVPSDKSLASTVSKDPAAVAQMDTISKASVVQSTLPEMANFWDPCANFGTALVNKEINQDNAGQKTADWAASYQKK
ncbi:ABC transporter substrate-binding protein [Bombiscardovia nodaiensis]|uniref:ABC transporter substrate-binding protein n=1 Tax=Bombiscardovia nodaiensis TaxID=2932181 RepID=A0ABM8B7P0_9BIFI|nr:ABC transporter substrate-binding protein [Bombiscardovia nodaiensis]